MKVLFLSGREPTYVRNAIILKGLERNGHEIINCSDASSSYVVRIAKSVVRFLLKKSGCDIVFVGFFGQPLVPFVNLFTSKPIIFDAFLSAYDTLCFDRRIFHPRSPAGRFFFWLDKYSCRKSHVVLLDTKAHIDYFVETFGLPREKYHRLFVGADDVMFRPREDSRANGPFRVFYYATYLPLHGIEYIIRAAKKLERDTEIEFQLIGKGPLYKSVRDLARGMEVHNVQFIEWVPFAELAERIAHADICLGGHFSDVDKAKRVIAGKTFQFIAMKKPVIVGDCNANRELLTHKENSFFVKMADADALSDAILELRKDDILREQIAEGGYKTFVKKCNINAIAADIGIITKIVRSTAI